MFPFGNAQITSVSLQNYKIRSSGSSDSGNAANNNNKTDAHVSTCHELIDLHSSKFYSKIYNCILGYGIASSTGLFIISNSIRMHFNYNVNVINQLICIKKRCRKCLFFPLFCQPSDKIDIVAGHFKRKSFIVDNFPRFHIVGLSVYRFMFDL